MQEISRACLISHFPEDNASPAPPSAIDMFAAFTDTGLLLRASRAVKSRILNVLITQGTRSFWGLIEHLLILFMPYKPASNPFRSHRMWQRATVTVFASTEARSPSFWKIFPHQISLKCVLIFLDFGGGRGEHLSLVNFNWKSNGTR